MSERNFKVGDHVVFRDWEDMEDEFGIYNDSIRIPDEGCAFVPPMMYLCGTKCVVTRVFNNLFGNPRINVDIDVDWNICPGMLRYVDEEYDPIEVDRSLFINLLSGA